MLLFVLICTLRVNSFIIIIFFITRHTLSIYCTEQYTIAMSVILSTDTQSPPFMLTFEVKEFG